MIVHINEFNEVFKKELLKTVIIKKYIKDLTDDDMNKIHKIFTNHFIRLLLLNIPGVLNFGKYFFLFSKLNNKQFKNRKKFIPFTSNMSTDPSKYRDSRISLS